MSDLDLSIDFKLNSPEAVAEADKVRKQVKGVGFDAEASAKRLLSNFNPAIGLLQQVEEEAKRLKKALKEASAMDVDKIRGQLAEVNTLHAQLVKGVTDGGQRAKSSFNGLQMSINQISRELPAFTYSAQTGFMAIANNIPILTDEISKLRKQNAELVASGQKGVPVWKQLVSGLFSWGTALSLGITLITIYGKEIGNFITALFKGREAIDAAKERLKALNETFKSTDYQNAVKGIMELKIQLDLAKKGMADKEAVVKQYNESIGKTSGQVSTLDEVEKGLVKNADNYIKMTLYKAAANLQLAEAAKKAAEIQEDSTKSAKEFANIGDKLISGIGAGAGGAGSQFGIAKFDQSAYEEQIKADGEKRKKAREKQLKEEQMAFEKNADELLRKASEYANKMGGKLGTDTTDDAKKGKKEENAMLQALERRKDILNKIADLDAEYSRKSFTKDEEELQALKDKFAKARRIIEEFNADPKNKKVAKVSASVLDPIEQEAIVNLTYRQDTEKLKKSLDEQKQLYAEFEDFKKKNGEEAAKERFGKELDTSVSYLEKLQKQYDELNGKENKSGAEQERLKELKTRIDAETAAKRQADNKAFAEAFEAAKTHAQRLLDIQREYEEQVKALGESATAEQIANLRRIRDEKAQAENMANTEQETNYKNTLLVIDELSRTSALEKLKHILSVLEAERKANRISVADYKQKVDEINAAIARINGSNGSGANPFKNALDAVKNWRDIISKIPADSVKAKDAFKSAAGSISDAANASAEIVGTIAQGLDSLGVGSEQLQKDLGNVAGMLAGVGDLAKGIATGNPVDIVRGSVNLLTNAIELFNFKDKKTEKRIKAYQQQLRDLGKAFDDLERSVSNSVGESYYSDSQKQVENLRKQQELLQKSIDAERSKKKGDKGKIDAWKQQLDTIPAQIDEINKAVSEMLVQTTFKDFANQLADVFTEAFAAGESAAGRFEDVFNKVIQNSVKNSLKLKLIEPEVKRFTDAMTAYMQANNNSVTGFNFDYWKRALKSAGDNMTGALKGFEDFFKEDLTGGADANTLKGAWKGMSSEEAGLLSGQFGGQRIATLEGNEINRQGYDRLYQSGTEQLAVLRAQHLTQLEISANTLRTANNTERLQAIETHLQSMDRKMTNGSNTARAMGMG